ncbi:hypothetical protein [Hydrogenobaculum sp.]
MDFGEVYMKGVIEIDGDLERFLVVFWTSFKIY